MVKGFDFGKHAYGMRKLQGRQPEGMARTYLRMRMRRPPERRGSSLSL